MQDYTSRIINDYLYGSESVPTDLTLKTLNEPNRPGAILRSDGKISVIMSVAWST